MRTIKYLLGAVLASVIGVGSAVAAPVLIDNLTTTQNLANTAAGTLIGDSTSAGLAGILGGQRDVVIRRTDSTIGSTNGARIDINSPTASEGLLSTDVGISAIYFFQYDGSAAGTGLTQGLSSIDLTGGGTNSRIDLGIEFVDLAGTQFRFIAYTGAGNASSSSVVLGPIAAATTVSFDFGSFVTALGTGADFTSLTAIQLIVSHATDLPFDARINNIVATTTTTTTTSGVSEPGVLALIGVGILGLGLARRRCS